MRNQIHTTHNSESGRWTVKAAGNPNALRQFRTKAQAVEAGRAYAKMLGAEHKIHNMNGRIASGDSYGNDPFPPRG